MKKRILSLLLAGTMMVSLAACGSSSDTTDQPSDAVSDAVSDSGSTDGATVAELRAILDKYEYGVDYIALYKQFSSDVTIDEVIEDEETGNAYIERDGVLYTLGLDFLSWAMVFNTSVPEGGIWETEDDVYATWWKLYIQRWNNLLPEIPLYSNEYYDLYNTQITGVEENPTNPYWGVAYALIDWESSKADNSIIIGNSTELSGAFRYSSWTTSSPGAADQDIEKLTSGLSPVEVTSDGGYQWNDNVVKSHSTVENDDGSLTFNIELYDDLKLSDGSAVTAKNYLVRIMMASTPVYTAATGVSKASGQTLVGYSDFSAYDGTEGTKEFAGLRMIDDYNFSLTVDAEYASYFYADTFAALSCDDLALWIDDADIVDDGNGCYFTDEFYAKNGDNYVLADHINAAGNNTDTTYPYSGPYVVESFDVGTSEAVLSLNPYFKGNYAGSTPSIEKVIYKKIITATQLDDFRSGGLDFLAGITGGDATDEAIAAADNSNGAYGYIHYSRAGYGKMGFRADYGPVQFTEVRQAIAYCLDRASFAKTFTGGYGGVVDGPYYTGSWMYQEAVSQGMILNSYSTSVDTAIAVLEEGGWVYDKDGNAYTSGVRYKQIPADEINENDKIYQSKDGAYVTTQVGDYYYMPLALNWYGTSDNDFSDLLVTEFVNNDNIANAGFNVQYTFGDFAPMLDELYQEAAYGYYSGTPMYCIFNFATGFTSAAYDYSYNLTIDPDLYDLYSQYYIKDAADAYWLQ